MHLLDITGAGEVQTEKGYKASFCAQTIYGNYHRFSVKRRSHERISA